MKSVRYAGGTFVTGDGIAAALFAYTAALANLNRAKQIEVPIVDALDQRDTVLLVIGPASQFSAVSVAFLPELEDQALVSRLENATKALVATAGVAARFSDDEVDAVVAR
jgi:hypothetical protein